MSETPIICKATRDTFMRFGIVIAAFLGFAGYFFYDGAIGYRVENEQILCRKQFSRLGSETAKAMDDAQWQEEVASKPLIKAREGDDGLVAVDGEGHVFPLPADCEAAKSFPQEAADRKAMAEGWNECWKAYSSRRHFPITPPEHAHDTRSIMEQWFMGYFLTVAGLIALYLVARTAKREMSLRGDQVTAAGRKFSVSDIESIDLRQWGPGFKGVAYFTVKGKRVRADGMTYGGFSEEKGQPAEQFMKALLAQYKGEIIEYEEPAAK